MTDPESNEEVRDKQSFWRREWTFGERWAMGILGALLTAAILKGAPWFYDEIVNPKCKPNLTLFDPTVNGMTVTINGITGENPGCPKVTHIEWDWDDKNVENSFFDATHTYDSPATYQVRATATDSDGHSTTQAKTVVIN